MGAVISGRSITDLQKPLQGDLAQLADRFRDLVAEFEEEGSVESSRMDEFARKVLQVRSPSTSGLPPPLLLPLLLLLPLPLPLPLSSASSLFLFLS